MSLFKEVCVCALIPVYDESYARKHDLYFIYYEGLCTVYCIMCVCLRTFPCVLCMSLFKEKCVSALILVYDESYTRKHNFYLEYCVRLFKPKRGLFRLHTGKV